MPDVQIGMLIFIILVVGIGGGWFIREANKDEEK